MSTFQRHKEDDFFMTDTDTDPALYQFVPEYVGDEILLLDTEQTRREAESAKPTSWKSKRQHIANNHCTQQMDTWLS